MDDNDDYSFDSPSIDNSSSSRSNNNNRKKVTKRAKTHKNSSSSKDTSGQVTDNLLFNFISNVHSLLSSKKYNKNENILINGYTAIREDEDSYQLINADFEAESMYVNKMGNLHRNIGPALVYKDGTHKYYFNGNLHRNENDGPAVTEPNGSNIYYNFGRKHRYNNHDPAQTIIHPDNTKEERYYLENKLHRLEGPAITNSKGEYFYYNNGNLHNEHGPASHTLVEGSTDKFKEQYWIHGKQLSSLQFSMLKLRNKVFKNTISDMKYNH